MAEKAKADPPKWQILDQIGENENDDFDLNLYKYKMPNLFEFITKEVIDNQRLKQLIAEKRSPQRVKKRSGNSQDRSLPRNFGS